MLCFLTCFFSDSKRLATPQSPWYNQFCPSESGVSLGDCWLSRWIPMVPTSSALLNLGCYWELLTFQMNRHWLIYSSSYGTFSTILILQSPVIWCMELAPTHPLCREKSRTGKGRKGRTEGAPAIAKTKKEGGLHGPADKLHPLVHWRTDTAYIWQNADALAPAQTSWIISEEVRGRMCQYSCFEQVLQVSLMHDKVWESLRQNVGRCDLSGSPVFKTLCSQGRSQSSPPGPGTRSHRSQLGVCMPQIKNSTCQN